MVAVATVDHCLIGFMAFHAPAPNDIWSTIDGARELGAVEVATEWRRHGIGSALLEASLDTGKFEDKILYFKGLSWHWDLEKTGLSTQSVAKIGIELMKPQRKVYDPVFGPYESRRFGRSLGVNPLRGGPKICTFDCIYCECGPELSGWHYGTPAQFSTLAEIRSALEAASRTHPPDDLDALTIAGNGEPTLHPKLGDLVDVALEVRKLYWPRARTIILTNGTTGHRKSVRAALEKVNERIVKLDAGTAEMLRTLNRPVGHLRFDELLRRISLIPDITIQAMFVHGSVDNTSIRHVKTWAGWIRQISPKSVQIYSIDRMPALDSVSPVSRDELDRIARYVEQASKVPALVF